MASIETIDRSHNFCHLGHTETERIEWSHEVFSSNKKLCCTTFIGPPSEPKLKLW